MGVGITATARVPKKGLLSAVPRDELFRSIEREVRGAAGDPISADCFSAAVEGQTLLIEIHPGTEPLRFEYRPGRVLVFDTKTSTLGPGYHAFVVDLLKRIGPACGLAGGWDWSQDETDFSRTGDFGALQRTMREQLQAMGRSLLGPQIEGQGYTNLAVNWSVLGAMPAEQRYFTITPSGPLSREWWEKVGAGEAISERCGEFYVWWGRERDAAYWRKLGLMLLWSEVPWRPPASEPERRVCETAVWCFERARELDGSIEVPEGELEELRGVLAAGEDERPVPPGPVGIGFKRELMRFHLPGVWSIVLPGYYHSALEDDGSTHLFAFDRRTVRISTISVNGRDHRPAPAAELAGVMTDRAPPGSAIVEHRAGHLYGRAYVERLEEEGEEGLCLRGSMAKDGAAALVTICYQEESDAAWAEEVFRSVSAPDPGGR